MPLRLVATSDTHAPVDPKSIPDGDVFIHGGDLMTTGYLDEWKWAVEWLSQLPHKTKIFVPGNHDFHLQVYPGPALQNMRKAGVTVIGLPGNNAYTSCLLPNDQRLLGLPYVMDLPRWAFNITEPKLKTHLNMMNSMHKYDIVVSHSPIHGVLDFSSRNDEHAGIKAYRAFCETQKPKVWINGHIHEGYGTEKFGDTQVYNVAMCNRNEEQVNKPFVIDV